MVIEFPVNLGHGVALQVTYRYCIEHKVKYVITLDADGQNDPAEMPNLLAPLANDTADFVLTSRVLGEDKTSDGIRKTGVRFFSLVMNRMTACNRASTRLPNSSSSASGAAGVRPKSRPFGTRAPRGPRKRVRTGCSASDTLASFLAPTSASAGPAAKAVHLQLTVA